jgi:hypothetical protein
MSTTAITVEQQENAFVVISTAQVGPPGPDGAAGSTGPQGDSGLPGIDIALTIDPDTGDPIITSTTHWWIDTDGNAHFEADPANVPSGEEAWFDPATFSVIPGLPGTTFAVTRVNGQTGDITIPADGDPSTPGLRSLGTGANQAMVGSTPVDIIGSNAWLIMVAAAQAFASWSSATYDSNGALLTANLTWPDGTSGIYIADTVSTSFPGAIDAWHCTYIGSTTKTVTQPAVTRNGSGLVVTSPLLVVS